MFVSCLQLSPPEEAPVTVENVIDDTASADVKLPFENEHGAIVYNLIASRDIDLGEINTLYPEAESITVSSPGLAAVSLSGEVSRERGTVHLKAADSNLVVTIVMNGETIIDEEVLR
jgi:hypothetical protein